MPLEQCLSDPSSYIYPLDIFLLFAEASIARAKSSRLFRSRREKKDESSVVKIKTRRGLSLLLF